MPVSKWRIVQRIAGFEMGVEEIPDELIQKAEIIVHQVSVGIRNRG